MMSGSSQVHVADLSRHRIHNGARASGTNPLSLQGTAAEWSYLLELPVPELAPDDAALYTVEVRIRALTGALAAGILSTDRKTFRDERTIVPGDATAIELAAGPLRGCRGLVVRTVANHPAAAEIESVRWRRLDTRCEDFFAAPSRAELVPVPAWNRYYGRHGNTLERLRSVCYDAIDAPRTIPWLFGLRIVVHPRELMSRALFVSGLYEPATMIALRRVVKEGAVVVDAGANAGLISIACARWAGAGGRVLAFEPSRREHTRLIEHVRLNDLHNVTAFRSALGAAAGVQELKVAEPHNSGLNTLGSRLAYDGVAVVGIERVDVVTLDDIGTGVGLDRLDVMKLDVEGAELAVLRGSTAAIRRFRPVLVFEALASALASHGHTLQDLDDFVRGLDYDLFRIAETGDLVPCQQVDGDAENFVATPRA